MFLKHTQIAPARISGLLSGAEAAARALPPAFPLEATVAVNPFLGQSGEDLATASARLGRVSGVRLAKPRQDYAAEIRSGRISDDDLADALFECPSPLKPVDLAFLKARLNDEPPLPVALPTVADLAAQVGGKDWPGIVSRSVGLWAGGHFDQGQAFWTPAPGQGAFAAWRNWATHDLTPGIAGLGGFCSHVADAPDTAERAILRAADKLGVTEGAAETVFHRLLMDLGGWAQHARWLLWKAEQAGANDTTLIDLLAIRLVWEEALYALDGSIADKWRATIAEHERPVTPTQDQVIDAILQDAAERAYQRQMTPLLNGCGPADSRPVLQAAFCIDVRSEVFRKALEATAVGVETIGFAGFFGLPLAHCSHGTDDAEPHLPVLLRASMRSTSHAAPAEEQSARIAARATRAWGRFRQAAVSSFAFVEAAGPAYGLKLVRDTFGWRDKASSSEQAPSLEESLTPEAKAEIAAGILKAMSLTKNFAPTVLLLGHGADVTNSPHESAYHCGACGGHTGEVSARVLATLLNDLETRAGLSAHGIDVPEDTRFVAGLHVTTTDEVVLYPDPELNCGTTDLSRVRAWLDRARQVARTERAVRLPGADAASLSFRARNWAEPRPEWGLAGCAAFIAAPRERTVKSDLGGRAFLHDYDWRSDEGFRALELILTAPVVVASWINLQYFGSAVAPDAFGGGNKLIHNVTGGIGVVEGNGGMLRTGLPWQAVHGGDTLAHEPLRLSVFADAPRDAIIDVLSRHDNVRALFDNRWLHLFALNAENTAFRYRPGLSWYGERALRAGT